MGRFYLALVYIVGTLTASSSLASQGLPPLGQRLYEAPPDGSPYQPVRILKDGRVPASPSRKFLKDPIFFVESEKPIEKVAVPKPPKPVAYKESKLQFTKLDVSGRYAKPRLQFYQERLAVEPVDERIDFDFLDRMLETSRRQEALLTAPSPL